MSSQTRLDESAQWRFHKLARTIDQMQDQSAPSDEIYLCAVLELKRIEQFLFAQTTEKAKR